MFPYLTTVGLTTLLTIASHCVYMLHTHTLSPSLCFSDFMGYKIQAYFNLRVALVPDIMAIEYSM